MHLYPCSRRQLRRRVACITLGPRVCLCTQAVHLLQHHTPARFAGTAIASVPLRVVCRACHAIARPVRARAGAGCVQLQLWLRTERAAAVKRHQQHSRVYLCELKNAGGEAAQREGSETDEEQCNGVEWDQVRLCRVQSLIYQKSAFVRCVLLIRKGSIV